MTGWKALVFRHHLTLLKAGRTRLFEMEQSMQVRLVMMKKNFEEAQILADRATWHDVLAGVVVYAALLVLLVFVSVGTHLVLG